MPTKPLEPRSRYYSHNPNKKFWYYKSDPGVKHNNHQCRTCIYRSNHHDQNADLIHSDYIGMTGHMRGCHSSPTCTKYVKGKRLRTKQHFNPHHKNGFKGPDKVPYVKLTKWISK